MAHKSRSVRGTLKINPGGMPTFMDSFFVKKDNVLHLKREGIMRDNEDHCRDKIEEIKGFDRWCTDVDIDLINDQIRTELIKTHVRKPNKKS